MKINAVRINGYFATQLGLQQGELSQLGNLVVLTGPNGCGKTRVLAALDWMLEQRAAMGHARLADHRNRYEDLRALLDEPASVTDFDQYRRFSLHHELGVRQGVLERLDALDLAFAPDEEQDASLRRFAALSDFLRREPEPLAANSARLSIGHPRPADDFSRSSLLASPLSYVRDLAERLRLERTREEQGQGLAMASIDSTIDSDFAELGALLQELAGLTLRAEGVPVSIDGIPLEQLALSAGQNQLLRWGVLLHSKALEKFPLPVLLDEPELHLHPDALIKLVDMLRVRLPEMQLWIATHSLPLIAHLASSEPRCLWFGERGKFSKAGGRFEQVTTALFGGAGGAEKLVDFCAEPARFGANCYAAECLMPPESVEFKAGDPQLSQIWARLARANTAPIRILDFGAGKGRLLDGLAAQCRERGVKLADVVSYFALEIDPVSLAKCTETVAMHYGPGARAFGSSQEALMAIGADSVDVLVLTNVLHEILPQSWLSAVFTNADLQAMLVSDGALLIVEDTRLGTGELAHEFGYLVLESQAIEQLFAVTAADQARRTFETFRSSSHGERLQATVIARDLLPRTSTASIVAALSEQKTLTLRAIRAMRAAAGGRRDYLDGRQHAFQAQHVANLTLALEDMTQSGAVGGPVTGP